MPTFLHLFNKLKISEKKEQANYINHATSNFTKLYRNDRAWIELQYYKDNVILSL